MFDRHCVWNDMKRRIETGSRMLAETTNLVAGDIAAVTVLDNFPTKSPMSWPHRNFGIYRMWLIDVSPLFAIQLRHRLVGLHWVNQPSVAVRSPQSG